MVTNPPTRGGELLDEIGAHHDRTVIGGSEGPSLRVADLEGLEVLAAHVAALDHGGHAEGSRGIRGEQGADAGRYLGHAGHLLDLRQAC